MTYMTYMTIVSSWNIEAIRVGRDSARASRRAPVQWHFNSMGRKELRLVPCEPARRSLPPERNNNFTNIFRIFIFGRSPAWGDGPETLPLAERSCQ